MNDSEFMLGSQVSLSTLLQFTTSEQLSFYGRLSELFCAVLCTRVVPNHKHTHRSCT